MSASALGRWWRRKWVRVPRSGPLDRHVLNLSPACEARVWVSEGGRWRWCVSWACAEEGDYERSEKAAKREAERFALGLAVHMLKGPGVGS